MPVTPEQQADIDALRSEQNQTLRAVSVGMENHLYRVYRVLDHGFVRVVDYMGDDAAMAVVQSQYKMMRGSSDI